MFHLVERDGGQPDSQAAASMIWTKSQLSWFGLPQPVPAEPLRRHNLLKRTQLAQKIALAAPSADRQRGPKQQLDFPDACVVPRAPSTAHAAAGAWHGRRQRCPVRACAALCVLQTGLPGEGMKENFLPCLHLHHSTLR